MITNLLDQQAECSWCNTVFTKKRKDQKHCSRICSIKFYKKAWRLSHKEYHNEYSRKWYRENHDKAVEQRRKSARKYSGCINPSGETNKTGECPICLRIKKLVYDHDHKSGDHRGWLCSACNWRLGWFELYKENIVTYLESTQ